MRVAVVIGCNTYESASLEQLVTAELDASKMFSALTDQAHGGYSSENSILLHSPTYSEVRSALAKALVESGSLDTFTFYFAGHGCVRAGSFYMLGRDAKENSLAFTGLSLSDLFRMIADANPSQANIVIDACEAGGLISDLSSILKPELLGDAKTLSITLLATAAQNESAEEDEAGGVATQVIVKCIRGEEFVQSHSPMLDLMDVGRHVARQFQGAAQTPVVWGLNLSATSQFSANSFYSAETASSVQVIVKEWEAKTERSLQEHAKALWDLHSAIETDWNPSQARTVLQKVYADLCDQPAFLVSFVRRLRSSLMSRAESSVDKSRPIEVLAILAVALLQYAKRELVSRLLEELQAELWELISQMCEQLIQDLDKDPYALLENSSGIATLYTLPIRLTNILGWAALQILSLEAGTPAYTQASSLLERVADALLAGYSYSITPVSERQAPAWCLLLAALHRAGLVEQAETVIGHLFNRLVRTTGRILRVDASGEDVVSYLLAVDCCDYSAVEYATERPTETLTVALRAAFLAGMGELIDDDLWLLDGCSFMAFVPQSYEKFDDSYISGGENLEWHVGNQVFRVEEFAKTWPSIPGPSGAAERTLCMMASLLFPDRVAWFCL